MSEETQIVAIVRAVLEINKRHWLEQGTPIRPEDAPLVAVDVQAALGITDRRSPLSQETVDELRETAASFAPVNGAWPCRLYLFLTKLLAEIEGK